MSAMGFLLLAVALFPSYGSSEMDLSSTVDDTSLPDVDTIMSKANDTLQDFTAQAKSMQERAQANDKAAREALSKDKNRYERKLVTQNSETAQIKKDNDDIRMAISTLNRGNDALRRDARDIKKGNALMFQAIKTLEPKMQTARVFLEDALKLTSQDGKDELKVLEKPAPEPTLDHFLAVMHEDVRKQILNGKKDKDLSVALLATNAERHAGGQFPKLSQPEGMVPLLSQNLEDLEISEKEGATKMKAQFLAFYEMGDNKRRGLMEEQERLKGEQGTVVTLQAELHAAKKHLKETQKELKDRLKGLRVFAEKARANAAKSLKMAEDISKKGKANAKVVNVASLGNNQTRSLRVVNGS